MDNGWAERTAIEDFKDARRRAFLTELIDSIWRRDNKLLSFEEVRARLNIRGQRYLGHQTIPLDHIVGSEGRYFDFDRSFSPKRDTLQQRWSSVDRAIIQSVDLPPIDVYKIGDIYFVRDGNHRVSVARMQGASFIDAYVTELVVDVPLDPSLSLRDLMLKEEYSDFLEWTNLAQLRPEQRIEFSEPGGYLDLVRDINKHRYYMGLNQKRDIDRDEAITDWYDNVYMAIVQVIRDLNVLQSFPGRSEADLYRWIVDHRWYTRERTGADLDPATATSDYVNNFGKKPLVETLGDALRAALSKIGARG